jgi:WhiB family transcriptional regulator, redox-sensing transcriptional regulator
MKWTAYAACSDVDPELFFPISTGGPSQYRTEQARVVCAGCSVRLDCLDWALEHEIQHGVWGGLSEEQRRVIQGRRQPDEAATS